LYIHKISYCSSCLQYISYVQDACVLFAKLPANMYCTLYILGIVHCTLNCTVNCTCIDNVECKLHRFYPITFQILLGNFCVYRWEETLPLSPVSMGKSEDIYLSFALLVTIFYHILQIRRIICTNRSCRK
jgi:hypothetical protein